MAGISTSIELYDAFSSPMANIVQSANAGVSAMEQMQNAMNASVNTAAFQGVSEQANQAASAVADLGAAVAGLQDTSCDVTVTPVVTQQPQIDLPEDVTVGVNAETEAANQRITEVQQRLQSIIPIQEAINTVASNCYVLPEDANTELKSVNREIQRMQAALDYLRENPFNLDSSFAELQIESISESIDETISRQRELNSLLGNIPSEVVNIPVEVQPNAPNEPVEVPVHWQSDNLEVFTHTGIERFEMEVQSVNNMLDNLNQTQQRIAQTAAQTDLFPANAVADMNNMQNRLQAIAQRIQQIESNPLNMGTDTANAELEQLRGQLDQAVQIQEELNRAVENMDVQAANDAYLRLSQTVGNTERYIRDNVDEQGRFNREIENGTNEANKLMQTIKGAVGAYLGISGIKKAFSFIEDCTNAFNTQLNAETQLISVLANMLDEDYVSQFELETTADTAGAINEINDIQNSVDEVVVPVTAESRALTAAFDDITAKAAEIQGRGIYGDEAMIAAAAEFSTYFSDKNAITKMMDTLADYAMGMSGGGELGAQQMVDYATNLGKIMSGAYDAMTKKGFEFTDAQKAIIEGTATHEQIVSELGEEYLDVSSDMQAAAAITSVIDESWAGLYETMSNTPEGKIIQMNNALGDMKEVIGKELYPYVILFVDAINNNWGTIKAVIQDITTRLKYMLGVLSWIVEGAFKVASVIIDNWSLISPIIDGIAVAVIGYNTALAVYNKLQAISNGLKAAAAFAEQVHAASLMMEQGATFAATAAQYGFNAALLACPITWIIIAIIALIALFYIVIAVINKVCDTQISATGIILGTIEAIGAFLYNKIAFWWNIISAFIEFVVNVRKYPEYAVKALLVNLTNAFLGFFMAIIKGNAAAIGAICGSLYALKQFFANRLVDMINILFKQLAAMKYQCDSCVYAIKNIWYKFVDFILNIAQSVADGMGDSAQAIADVFVSAANIAIRAINGIVDILSKIPGVDKVLGAFVNGPFDLIDPASVSDISDKIAAAREEWSKSKPIEPEFIEPEHIEYSATVEEMYNAGKQAGEEWVTGIEGTIENLQAEMQNWLGEKPEDYWEAPKLDYKNLGDAARSGYDLGKRIANLDPSSLFGTTDIPSPKDYANSLAGGAGNGIGNGVNDIADNTGGAADSAKNMEDNVKDIADDMDILDEELKYLRDIAERDVINRFTTAELKVEFHNENNINSELDIDGIVEEIGARTLEELEAVAEGVYS